LISPVRTASLLDQAELDVQTPFIGQARPMGRYALFDLFDLKARLTRCRARDEPAPLLTQSDHKMLRDKNLIPLSHQHRHVLALCVRIDRASPIPVSDLPAWQTELAHLCQTEIAIHFAAEEQVLFPSARRFSALIPLVEDLLTDHTALRHRFAKAESREMSADDLSATAQLLSAHIRKEERQLFEHLQKLLNHEDLAILGSQLHEALKGASQVCALPTEATKLRSAK
jgi:hemerythrin-like domain-containing protein